MRLWLCQLVACFLELIRLAVLERERRSPGVDIRTRSRLRPLWGFIAMVVRIAVAAVSWSLIATSAFAINPVPELDPGSAVTALTLLAGGLVVLRGRRRR